MRKFLLLALTGTTLALALPTAASAAPASGNETFKAAAESVAPLANVHYRWHHRHWHHRHWRHRHWHHRPHYGWRWRHWHGRRW
jgi:hypothetical protein